ncbi:MAG TPA: ADP-ribosylglycohydrolase family protein, partial [Niabella sp.]|nr:ADP-ribosylglycohydrolase family protein [Niabella sp.]
PYKQCLNMVIELAEKGKSFREIVNVVEDRWHLEYPATNNAVANGGIVAACVWFGSGDFLKTVNLAFEAADFSDADCNAANAAAVIGAMHGLKGIPENLICVLGDIIKGEKMGGVKLTPVVNESLLAISKRTVDIGKRMLMQHGTNLKNHNLIIPIEPLKSLPSEIFTLSDLMDYWNPDWQLERAGFGGAGGGMRGIRGITYLNDTILATYPRDEVRGLFLKREITIQEEKELFIEVGVDKNRCWELNIYIDNEHVLRKLIEGKDMERTWFSHKVDLAHYQGKAVTIRMFQKVLLPGKEAGNAYWKTIRIF